MTPILRRPTEESTVAEPNDPISVYRQLLAGISKSRWHELADLYAEGCIVEIPLALPEPDRVVGREAIRERFAAAATGPFQFRVSDLRLHLTVDPEVVIGEFEYHGLMRNSGRTFTVANVQVVRVSDGLIQSTRDYHDHARLGELMRTEPS
jgi:uncharacterized protein